MFIYSLKTGICLLCFAFTLLGFCRPAAAQIEAEMKILRMFYREKDLIVTATRHPKPISQVAENISVITAREIEEMNAHSVAEILNRIPGLFINFNQDFGAASLLYIQGSDQRHVLVLVDGFPWNYLNSGHAETHSIPVEIIDRIEIIKGPASSAWGSSLGGVINIITKPAGDTKRPTGLASASFGERNTEDLRAEIAGQTDQIRYYLFAGKQDSNGLKDSRDFDTYSLYSKFKIPLSDEVKMGLTLGYSEPEILVGDFPTINITQSGDSRTFFATASLEAELTRDLTLNMSFHHFKQKTAITNNFLTGSPPLIAPGDLLLENIGDEKTTGARAKLMWEQGIQTAVLGLDFDHGELEQTIQAGSLLQAGGIPATTTTKPQIDKWAIYLNDTISLSRWTITPGLRYDRDSITGSFISPSLGVTYKAG